MKHWKIILGLAYVIVAFVMAYYIDFEESSRFYASTVCLFAMLGGMRIEEAVNDRREEYLARRGNENRSN